MASVIGARECSGVSGILVSKVAGALFDYYKGLGHIGFGILPSLPLLVGVAYLFGLDSDALFCTQDGTSI